MTTASAIRIDDLYTTRAVSAHSYHEQLSADDVEQFHAQGWLAVEGVYSPSEVEAYKAALRDIIHGVSPACEGLYIQEEPYYAEAGETVSSEEERELRIRKLIWFVRADARLMQASRHPRLCTLLSQLIGSGSTMIQDMALLKPPRHGSEKPWHQDTAYFDWLPLGGIVGCWLALDQATVENGCMQVIPGSHLDGPVPHYHARDCQMADERVQTQRAIALPLAPGGCLFFSGLLHHGTPPNRSNDRRQALQFHFAAEGCTKMSFAEHAALFGEGGKYAGCQGIPKGSGVKRAPYPQF